MTNIEQAIKDAVEKGGFSHIAYVAFVETRAHDIRLHALPQRASDKMGNQNLSD